MIKQAKKWLGYKESNHLAVVALFYCYNKMKLGGTSGIL